MSVTPGTSVATLGMVIVGDRHVIEVVIKTDDRRYSHHGLSAFMLSLYVHRTAE